MLSLIRNNLKIVIIGFLLFLLDILFSLWFILDWRPEFMKLSPYRLFVENSLAEGKYSGPNGETFINGIVFDVATDTVEIGLPNKIKHFYKVLPSAKFILVSGENKFLELSGYKLSLIKKGNIVWVKVDSNNAINQIVFFQL